MKHKIITGLRTKNEEWIIGKNLGALQNFCDTVVVYDDQSTDKTEEICRSYDFVDWQVALRSSSTANGWNVGQQATDLFRMVERHDPDYVFILDADEIPTPSVVSFFNSIDENVNLWRTRMVNLFKDEFHYRVDKYKTPHHVNINWNPFSAAPWRKHTLMKYNKDIDYTYEPLRVGMGSFGPFHPAPNNVPAPHAQTEEFYVIHYGKISPSFLSGEKQKFYAKVDVAVGEGSYETRLAHHMACSGLSAQEPMTLVDANKEWFWND